MFLLPMVADGCFSWHHLVHHDHLRPMQKTGGAAMATPPIDRFSQEPATRLGAADEFKVERAKQADQAARRWGYQAALKRELGPLLINEGMSK